MRWSELLVHAHEARLARSLDGHGDLRVTAGGVRIGEPHLVAASLRDLKLPPHGLRALAGAVIMNVVGSDEVGLDGTCPPFAHDDGLRLVYDEAGELIRVGTDVRRVRRWEDGWRRRDDQGGADGLAARASRELE